MTAKKKPVKHVVKKAAVKRTPPKKSVKKTVKRSATAKLAESAQAEFVTFTPTRDLPLTLNGETIDVQAGVEVTIPVTFKALYDNAVGS